MKNTTHLTTITLAVGCVLVAATSQAAVITIGTQGSFDSLGTIDENVNWDSYAYPGWTYPGSPFTVGDLTFVQGGQNLIGGGAYGHPRNLLTDNYIAGTTAFIAVGGDYNLLAFNAGNFLGTGDADIDIETNVGSYQYTPSVLDGSVGLTFLGFEAGPGEYFTGFSFSGPEATGITDIQLGSTQVPEVGSTLVLLGLACTGLVGLSRKFASV